ncbi:MAG: C40 family peptidase [Bacteroidota bacterium]
MVKKCLYLLSLVILPGFAGAQNFNDAPGHDDEKYVALIFPKTYSTPEARMSAAVPTAVVPTLEAKNLVDYASRFLGTKYHSGGTTANGFDCSGFTRNIFQQIGMELPHSSSAQSNCGIKIDLDQVRPGDLLFFTGGNRKSGRVGHVAMVSEITADGEIRMIHSTIHGGVMVDTPFNTAYYKPRYICARRVLKDGRSEL